MVQVPVDGAQKERLFPSNRSAETESVAVTLSILDATVARFSATGAIWIFDPPRTNKPIQALVDRCKSSLTTTLNSYPQWAGQLQWAPFRPGGGHKERFNRPMIVYGSQSDPGVEWVVVKQEYTVESLVPSATERASNNNGVWMATDFPQKDFLSSTPLALHNLSEYAGLPAMCVQISTFTCGGYAVAVKMAHPLADAQALMVFMHQWGATTRAQAGMPPQSLMAAPVFDPSQLDSHAAGDIDAAAADPDLSTLARSLPLHRFDWWETAVPGYLDMFTPTTEASKPPADQLASATLSPSMPCPWHTWDLSLPVQQAQLRFDEEELRRLRDTARAAPASRPHVSRLDALLAHLWGLINRARGHAGSGEDVFLNLTLGARGRVTPALPDSFVGSPLFLTYVKASGAAASDAASLGPVATATRETVAFFTPENMGALLHDASHEVAPQRLWQAFLGKQHTLVTSWMRLQVYGVDFEGDDAQPRYVQAVMPKMDGCVQIMDSAGVGGSLDVNLYLEKEAMGRLLEDSLLRAYKK